MTLLLIEHTDWFSSDKKKYKMVILVSSTELEIESLEWDVIWVQVKAVMERLHSYKRVPLRFFWWWMVCWLDFLILYVNMEPDCSYHFGKVITACGASVEQTACSGDSEMCSASAWTIDLQWFSWAAVLRCALWKSVSEKKLGALYSVFSSSQSFRSPCRLVVGDESGAGSLFTQTRPVFG